VSLKRTERATAPASKYHVDGKVSSRVSAAVDGLSVVIVDKAVGRDAKLAKAVTSADGTYQATFTDAVLLKRGKAIFGKYN
jgi:fibronectin type 3 domain-containing protein